MCLLGVVRRLAGLWGRGGAGGCKLADGLGGIYPHGREKGSPSCLVTSRSVDQSMRVWGWGEVVHFGKLRQMLAQARLITSVGKTHVAIVVATAQRFENSVSPSSGPVVGIIIFPYIVAISLEGLDA